MSEQKLVLKTDEQCSLSIQPVDIKGKRAELDGVPEWASSDPAIVKVVASADGLSADLIAQDIGSAQVSVTADADTGPGRTTITGTLDVQVQGGQAVGFLIVTGAITKQPGA